MGTKEQAVETKKKESGEQENNGEHAEGQADENRKTSIKISTNRE